MRPSLLGISTFALVAGLTSNAFAETTSAPTAGTDQTAAPSLAEVVVTAQRRSENLQAVPVTISAMSAQQLASAGVSNIQGLGLVTPGLVFQQDAGFLLPHLRGIGTPAIGPGLENSVALYVDGVYYATSSASNLNLNDISQTEVLKGPQGTLFGRNATGGLIQVLTKDPSFSPFATLSATYANYDTSTLDAYGTTKITDDLAGALSLHVSHQGEGWGRNVETGEDVYKDDFDLTARSKLLWKPFEGTTVRLNFDYEQDNNSDGVIGAAPGFVRALYGTAPTQTGYNVDENVQPEMRLQAGGVSVRVDQSLGSLTLVDITAYRQSSYYSAVDPDLGPAAYIGSFGQSIDKQVSEELQLISKGAGPFQWST
ncbi:MAG TPA: TonB-dependent receptor plug domain-containing protein, partial [Caulobacteraceae bacterium]|nr:TonB-dependent receptor plug domain-containing protein [Caulobacteraceae bacterium]